MKMFGRPTRILLFVMLALALGGALLLAGDGNALENLPGQQWELTPTAVARTAAGDCPTGMLCRELCYYSVPQGEFMCFNN